MYLTKQQAVEQFKGMIEKAGDGMFKIKSSVDGLWHYLTPCQDGYEVTPVTSITNMFFNEE